MKVDPYLNFGDRTEEAFNFYKSVFGGEFTAFQRFKDALGEFPEGDKEKIMHVSLPLGANTLMGSDMPETMMKDFVVGSNISLSVQVNSKEQAIEVFDKLASGGKITMPLADQFWGSYFGMLTDKYGVKWMVSYEYPKKVIGNEQLGFTGRS